MATVVHEPRDIRSQEMGQGLERGIGALLAPWLKERMEEKKLARQLAAEKELIEHKTMMEEVLENVRAQLGDKASARDFWEAFELQKQQAEAGIGAIKEKAAQERLTLFGTKETKGKGTIERRGEVEKELIKERGGVEKELIGERGEVEEEMRGRLMEKEQKIWEKRYEAQEWTTMARDALQRTHENIMLDKKLSMEEKLQQMKSELAKSLAKSKLSIEFKDDAYKDLSTMLTGWSKLLTDKELDKLPSDELKRLNQIMMLQSAAYQQMYGVAIPILPITEPTKWYQSKPKVEEGDIEWETGFQMP